VENFIVNKNIPIKLENFPTEPIFDKEANLLKIIENLSEQIKRLENNQFDFNPTEKDECSFRKTCYIATTKMGSCPCEHYK
jgi:hypothetical protein